MVRFRQIGKVSTFCSSPLLPSLPRQRNTMGLQLRTYEHNNRHLYAFTEAQRHRDYDFWVKQRIRPMVRFRQIGKVSTFCSSPLMPSLPRQRNAMGLHRFRFAPSAHKTSPTPYCFEQRISQTNEARRTITSDASVRARNTVQTHITQPTQAITSDKQNKRTTHFTNMNLQNKKKIK